MHKWWPGQKKVNFCNVSRSQIRRFGFLCKRPVSQAVLRGGALQFLLSNILPFLKMVLSGTVMSVREQSNWMLIKQKFTYFVSCQCENISLLLQWSKRSVAVQVCLFGQNIEGHHSCSEINMRSYVSPLNYCTQFSLTALIHRQYREEQSENYISKNLKISRLRGAWELGIRFSNWNQNFTLGVKRKSGQASGRRSYIWIPSKAIRTIFTDVNEYQKQKYLWNNELEMQTAACQSCGPCKPTMVFKNYLTFFVANLSPEIVPQL